MLYCRRLQAPASKGRGEYTNIMQTARRIWAEEGAASFFKGSGPRALVMGPLFGIALLSYSVCERGYHFFQE